MILILLEAHKNVTRPQNYSEYRTVVSHTRTLNLPVNFPRDAGSLRAHSPPSSAAPLKNLHNLQFSVHEPPTPATDSFAVSSTPPSLLAAVHYAAFRSQEGLLAAPNRLSFDTKFMSRYDEMKRSEKDRHEKELVRP